ncbi:MAG: hypothetical protein EKK48_23505 [Candidatus Melainabacteria bacterium]|nr:MAG: hypothetical protein EKK48_23505 [Candidatus Melainabacteria bacterium]
MAPKYDTADAQNASKGKVDDGVKYLEQQGRTSQDIQAYVRDLRQNNPDQYRATIDAVYNQVHSDARSNPTLNGLLPQIDLTDAAVDPDGAAGDRANFTGDKAVAGVQVDDRGYATGYGGTSADGKSGMFMDNAGRTTAFSVGDKGVQVTSTSQDGSVDTFNHTDVDPKSVKLDPNSGELTMNRTGLGDGQHGTVTVHPGGTETTQITNKDNTVTTVDRARAGGDVTKFASNAPGMSGVHCEDGQWTGLPGQADGKQPQNVRIEANGQISYDLPQGFKGHEGQTHVTLNEKGEPTYEQNQNGTRVKYDKDGNVNQYSVHNGQGDYTLTQRDGKWYYNREGSQTFVEIVGSTIKLDNGKVSFEESRGAHHTMSSSETTSDGIHND